MGVVAVGGLVAWSYYHGSSEESVDSTESIVKKDEAKDKLLEVAEKHHDAKVCMAELAAKYKLKDSFIKTLDLIDAHVKGVDLNNAMLPENGVMVFQEIKTDHKSHGFEMMEEFYNFQRALGLDEENVSHNGNTMLMLILMLYQGKGQIQMDVSVLAHMMKNASESYIKHLNNDGKSVYDLCDSTAVKQIIIERLKVLEDARLEDEAFTNGSTNAVVNVDQKTDIQPSSEELASAEEVLNSQLSEVKTSE